MLNLDTEQPRVFLCLSATDMRRSFDRLSQMVSEHMAKEVTAGGIFVFFSRCRSKAKLLYWDNDGYALWYKRLEVGTFKVKLCADGQEEISAVDLKLLLNGMDLSRIKLRDKIHQNVSQKVAA